MLCTAIDDSGADVTEPEASLPTLPIVFSSHVATDNVTFARFGMFTSNDQAEVTPVQPRLSPGFCVGSAMFDPDKRNDGLITRCGLADLPGAAPTDLVASIGRSVMETDSISTKEAVDVNMLQPYAALHRPLSR